MRSRNFPKADKIQSYLGQALISAASLSVLLLTAAALDAHELQSGRHALNPVAHPIAALNSGRDSDTRSPLFRRPQYCPSEALESAQAPTAAAPRM